MPYLDAALRLQLGLVESCPSEENITAACTAKGLQLRDGQLVPAAKPATKKPAAKATPTPTTNAA
jgi:hypothetical protein